MNISDIHKPGEYRHYLIGFALALMLTCLGFGLIALADDSNAETFGGIFRTVPWLVQFKATIPKDGAMAAIALLAVLQMGVHLRFFLHLSFDASNRAKMGILLFTLLIALIMLCGTIFVLSDLNRMMYVR